MLLTKDFFYSNKEPLKNIFLFLFEYKNGISNLISFMHFLGIQKLLSNSSSTQSKKILTMKKSEENNHENKQRTLVVGYGKKYRYMPDSNWCLGQKKSLSEKCENTNDQCGKAHCISHFTVG